MGSGAVAGFNYVFQITNELSHLGYRAKLAEMCQYLKRKVYNFDFYFDFCLSISTPNITPTLQKKKVSKPISFVTSIKTIASFGTSSVTLGVLMLETQL